MDERQVNDQWVPRLHLRALWDPECGDVVRRALPVHLQRPTDDLSPRVHLRWPTEAFWGDVDRRLAPVPGWHPEDDSAPRSG